MTTSDKEKEEGDNDASSETQEARSGSGEDEHWIDIAQRLEISLAKTKRLVSGFANHQSREVTSEDVDEYSSTMSENQVDLVHEVCRQGASLADICKMMGVPEGSVDPYDMKRKHEIATIMMGQSVDTQGEFLFVLLQAKAVIEK